MITGFLWTSKLEDEKWRDVRDSNRYHMHRRCCSCASDASNTALRCPRGGGRRPQRRGTWCRSSVPRWSSAAGSRRGRVWPRRGTLRCPPSGLSPTRMHPVRERWRWPGPLRHRQPRPPWLGEAQASAVASVAEAKRRESGESPWPYELKAQMPSVGWYRWKCNRGEERIHMKCASRLASQSTATHSL